MPTLTYIAYKQLAQRQTKLETEMNMLKKIIRFELGEETIRPTALKRWERISRDLDSGKGRSFASVKEMKRWLKNV